jgi:predicted histone-like DNA-binding protein
MSLKFKSQQKINPRDLTAPRKYYATAVTGSIVDLEELAEFVSDQSTISEADILGVLKAMERTMVREMLKGRSIRLGDIGSLVMTIQSEGQEKPEDVTSSSIKKARVNFRPGKRLRKMLKSLDFSKVQDQAA